MPRSGFNPPRSGLNLPSSGLNVPRGGLNRPWGGLNRPWGGLNLPWGRLNRPRGGLNRPWGGLNRPWGGLNRPWGGLNLPWGGLNRPWGGLNRPQGGLNRPWGRLNLPWGRLNLPSGWGDLFQARTDLFCSSARSPNLSHGSAKSSYGEPRRPKGSGGGKDRPHRLRRPLAPQRALGQSPPHRPNRHRPSNRLEPLPGAVAALRSPSLQRTLECDSALLNYLRYGAGSSAGLSFISCAKPTRGFGPECSALTSGFLSSRLEPLWRWPDRLVSARSSIELAAARALLWFGIADTAKLE
jgi:collagen type III alpha